MRSSGFSIIELMVAVALGGVAMGFIANSWKYSKYLGKIVTNDNDLQLIEEDVRTSILDRELLVKAGDNNANLKNCLTETTTPCKSQLIKKVALFNGSQKPATGSFYEWGRLCSSSSCPIKVEANALPICEGYKSSCKKAIYIDFNYSIKLRATNSTFLNDGTHIEYQKRTLRAGISDNLFKDTSTGCDLESGRPTFLSSIVSGRITQKNCLLPPGEPKVSSNVKSSRCPVRRILVGINSDGSIKCGPTY